MNLIEQLGGYEKALDLFRGCPWDSGTVDVPNPRSKGMLRLDLNDLGCELLEYRRQHNIFEVGDKVVHIFYKDSMLQRIKGVDGNYIYVLSHDESYQYKAYSPDFRHATDAEIKAGKRL